ncbi:MAG: hypothetical protein ACMUJM_11235 [bacterium]
MKKRKYIVYCGTFLIISGLLCFIKPAVCKDSKEIAGYERMSIQEFAETIHMNPDDMINTLKRNGMRVKDAHQLINDVAMNNEVPPEVIYDIMVRYADTFKNNPSDNPSEPSIDSKSDAKTFQKKKNKQKDGLGKGYGQQTIEEVCRTLNIPIEKAEKRLKAKGIVANRTTELRDIAGKYNVRPRDIVDIIKTKQKRFFWF